MSLISVRTDVVLDVLVGSMAEKVASRMTESLPASAEALDAWPDVLDDPAVARSAGISARAVAGDLARAGWLTRTVELERFPRAAEPGPSLAEGALELARREPLERPEPADETVTWRIPGPGGHVRHYLALRAIADRPGAAAAAAELKLSGPSDLKRCWVYGFVLCAAQPLGLT